MSTTTTTRLAARASYNLSISNIYLLISILIISTTAIIPHLLQPVETPAALTSAQVVKPSLSIFPELPKHHVSVEEEFSLKCKSQNGEPSSFNLKWRSARLDFEELRKRQHISISETEPGTLMLNFNQQTIDDSDNYTCYATLQGSDPITSSAVVNFYNPTKIIRCPDRQFLVAKESGRGIYCEFTTEAASVTIKKDGQTIDAKNPRYKWNKDTIEIIGPADATDAGNYSISILSDYTGKPVRVNIAVSIQSKPEILPPSDLSRGDQYYVIEGQPALLECPVSGNPQPIVTWLDPKKRNLTTLGGYLISPKGTLQITKVNRVDDQGNFSCHAKNDAGEATREFQMHVDVRPQIVAFSNKTVDEEQDVEFECRASGQPKPTFSIRRQGLNQKPLMPGDGLFVDADTKEEGGNSEVYVYRARARVNRSHFGQFYCNATNRAGTAEQVAHLSVNYKPDLSGTSGVQFVKLGKQFAVTCHIKAYPQPIVNWFMDGTQINNPVTNVKELPDKQLLIVTMSLNLTQSISNRKFVCRAENIAGISEVTISPHYMKPPGPVTPQLIDVTPTTVTLLLKVPDDGGSNIKYFRYSLDGKISDIGTPYTTVVRIDRRNESIIEALKNYEAQYRITNLLPSFHYRLSIRAENEVGEGGYNEFTLDTPKPEAPGKPNIVKPSPNTHHSTRGTISDHSNGYLLRWGPPDLDNGDPVTKYIIKWNEIQESPLGIQTDVGEMRVIEKVNDGSFHIHLGPLIGSRRYKIQVQAKNKYGESDPDHMIVFVPPDKPEIPDFQAQALSWLTESPSTLVAAITVCTVLLILIDLVFCLGCQMGLTNRLRNWCCPTKSNSVATDKSANLVEA